jgi:putative addiction module antidote
MQAHALKLTSIGNSVGVILPKELLNSLRVGKGDSLFATATPDGCTLTPYDPSVEEEIAIGQAFMNEYRETFKVLAK